MNKLTKKCVAAIASLAMAGTLCVAGAVTMAGVAWGDDPKPAPWETGAPSNGTIKIVKCEKVSDAKPASTSVSARPGGRFVPQTTACGAGFKPLAGAKFTLTKVTKIGNDDVNLTKFASWQKIAGIVNKLNDHTINEGTDITLDTAGATTSDATGANGTVTFDNRDLGLYKVEETQVPAGYGVSDLKSFYMTLPLPEYTTTGTGQDAKTTVSYEYNPTVKPKNKKLTDTIKKVYDKTKFASVKDKVPFTITAEVNKSKPATGALTVNDLQGYKVFDDAPTAAFKTIDKNVVKKVKINGTEVTNDGTNTYYNVSTVTASNNDDGKDLVDGHTRILVTFTDKGLQKIADEINKGQAGSTVNVEVDLEFELNADYQTASVKDGAVTDTTKDQIVNKSGFFQAHEKNSGDLPPIIPDSEHSQATIDFGYLQVYKYYMEGTEKKPLADAEFRIFADKDKANACAQGLAENKELSAIEACKSASTLADAGTDVKTTAKTNAEGKFATPYKTRAGVPVYLVEVQAPKGYIRSVVPYEATIIKDAVTPIDIQNLPLHGEKTGVWFNLPATGAAGVILFALAGMGLIAASVFLYMRNRKEEEQQQNA